MTQNPDEIISENAPTEIQHIQSSIPLLEGENILWHKETTQGLVHKEVVMEEAVTNKRCLKYDTKSQRLVGQIGITHWPEVVIMNVHRVNDSLGGGVFLIPANVWPSRIRRIRRVWGPETRAAEDLWGYLLPKRGEGGHDL
jgi:hypothetical protein